MSLRLLSDSTVLSRLHKLVAQEREITLLVLVHLNEVERRKLHLKLGHSSLFDYCTAKLGYSASAAVRRIRSARCAARFPRVYDMLKSNEVTVSTVSQASRALTDANHEELLARVRCKSQREVEAILAEYQPTPMPRERVRTVVIRVPVVPKGPTAGDAALPMTDPERNTSATSLLTVETGSSDACEKNAYNRNGCGRHAASDAACSEEVKGTATKLQRRTLLQFAASETFMAKLERIRSLAGHRLPPNASLEQLFELAMDLMIEREDPAKRIERREKRRKRRPQTESAGSNPKATPRYVPQPLRDTVFHRDGGRCTFVGLGGHRCEATVMLQVDHRVPVASGGTSIASNLRLLCAGHNQLEAVRLLGEDAELRRARFERSQ